MPCYFTRASLAPRIGPADLPWPVGVMPGPDKPGEIVGIAYHAGRVGGWRGDLFLGPVEVVWRLVIGKAEFDGRFVLRGGEFVELAEDAE